MSWIIFFYKIKVIFYPQVGNSTTHLTLLVTDYNLPAPVWNFPVIICQKINASCLLIVMLQLILLKHSVVSRSVVCPVSPKRKSLRYYQLKATQLRLTRRCNRFATSAQLSWRNTYRISSNSFRPWIVSAHLCTVTFSLMDCDLLISKSKKE